MTKIKYVKDKSGVRIYPITTEQAVVDNNGITLDVKLANITGGMDIVELSSASGVLTDEQFELVQSDHCIVKYDGYNYYKYSDGETECIYNRVTETKGERTTTDYYFTCTLANKGYSFSTTVTPAGSPDAVKYVEQELTSEQKAQARTNIGAADVINGITSATATVDNTSGNPSVSVNLSNQQLSLAFTGLKGEQGNTGSSVNYPYELVNNLTTNDATKGLSAAQGVVLEEEIGQLGRDVDLKIDGVTIYEKPIVWSDGYVNGSTGKITTSTASQFSQPVLLRAGETLNYKTGASYTKAVVRVTDDTAVAIGDTLSGSVLISYETANTDVSYTADEDMYIVITVQKASHDVTFVSTQSNSVKGQIGVLDQVLDISREMSWGDEIDLSSYSGETGYVIINSNNVLALNMNSSYKHKRVPIVGGKMYKIQAASDHTTQFCFSTSNQITTQSGAYLITPSSEGMVRHDISMGGSLVVTAPWDATYLWINTYWSGELNPSVFKGSYSSIRLDDIDSRLDDIDSRLDDIDSRPDDSGAIDSSTKYYQTIGFKRTRQQVLLKWTPRGAIPFRNGTQTSANVELTGMIYGETMEKDKRVGYDVSLLTFMTAVHNPYSVLYTENVSESRSASAYGNLYHGDSNSGPFYGSVCNTFAMLGVTPLIPFTTQQVWGNRTDLFEDVYDQSIRGLELMDLVGKNGHCLIVTKLVKDKYGFNTQVQLSEANGTFAANVALMDESSFASFLSTYNYTVKRFSELYKNIYFQSSPFVEVLGDGGDGYTYNDDICTIYGDYASILEGDVLHINYTKGSYTQMKIYKNDSLVETISLPNDSSIHDMDLTGYSFTYGKYKACLSDGTNSSDYTHWEVIKITVSLSVDLLSFSVYGGNPIYWDWNKKTGGPYISHIITDEEISSGVINVNENKGDYSYGVKVHAEGDYGRVSAWSYNGLTRVNKSFVWSDGYVNNGQVVASTSSMFCQPILFSAGETLYYRSGAGYTYAISKAGGGDEIAVGASGLQLIQSARENILYSYTFTSDTYVVLSVKRANYGLEVFRS